VINTNLFYVLFEKLVYGPILIGGPELQLFESPYNNIAPIAVVKISNQW
jgi:hypothetical protein